MYTKSIKYSTIYENNSQEENYGLYFYGVVAAAVILFLIILATGYVKASPDTAFIISGLRKKPKVLIGKAGIKIPFLKRRIHLISSLFLLT